MNHAACQQADNQFYKNHPELVDQATGARKPLTIGAKDSALRKEWMQDYKAADQAIKTGVPACDVGGVLAPCAAAAAAPPPGPAAGPAPATAGPAASPAAGPAPAAGPPAAAPPPSCTVEVRATKLSPLGYYHMYVVYTDANGKQFYLRGGPSPKTPVGSGAMSSEMSGGSSASGSVKSSASSSDSSDSSADSSGSSSSDSSKSGPSGSNPSASSDSSGDAGTNGPFGSIVTVYGDYAPPGRDPVTGARTGSIDWDPAAKSVVVSTGPGTCGKYDDLKKAFDGVAATNTRYNPLGPNSNSTVFSALKKVGITPKVPDDVWVPGYDTPIDIK